MPKDKEIVVEFSGINYPGAQYGFDYDVNQTYTLPWDSRTKLYIFEGQPDASGNYPHIHARQSPGRVDRAWSIWYRLMKGGGTVYSDVFDGFGLSPIENRVVVQDVAYGGIAAFDY